MELHQHQADFEASGIVAFVILPEPVETLARFSKEYGVDFPVLSDQGSKVIREFGILNTLILPDEEIYGIPYPGSYLVGEDGRIVAKYFHREYRVRETAGTVLHSGFHLPIDLSRFPHAGLHAAGVQISAALGAEELKFMQAADLYVRLRLAEGLHIYGPSTPEGYYPTKVTVVGPEGLRAGEATYPPARPFRIEGLHEEFHVLDGDVEVVVPLVWELREGESLPVDIEVQYQACSDRECFLPMTERLLLEVPLGRLNSQRR